MLFHEKNIPICLDVASGTSAFFEGETNSIIYTLMKWTLYVLKYYIVESIKYKPDHRANDHDSRMIIV